MVDLARTLMDWIAIPSVTGTEADYADALGRSLADRGLDVERQELAPGRFNLLARAGVPRVVFCTHLDTVPPWFGPERSGGVVTGRGACDAKGPALAMLEATRQLLAEGEERVGLLFTVGEEVDSAGARLADERLAEPWRPAYTVVGEPTENRFVRGHKGLFTGVLHATGVAGHSSEPLGPSAVHELVGCLHGLLSESWGEHPVVGAGSLNVGVCEGGVAGNVVADRAEAQLVIRAVEEPAVVEARLEKHLGPNVSLQQRKGYAPVEFALPAGCDPEEAPVVGFGTDAPHMPSWGKPLLYGPGSIRDAHTDHEKLEWASFERAVGDYARIARELLERVEAAEAAGAAESRGTRG